MLLLRGVGVAGEPALAYGFDGPTLYGVESVESTYASELTVRFKDAHAMRDAIHRTQWDYFDAERMILIVDTVGSYIKTREPERNRTSAYYAQFLLIDEGSYSQEICDDVTGARAALERIAANIR